ncbi:MAG: alpha/beta fold hydrolase [Solirubrobacteraceae bacterium]
MASLVLLHGFSQTHRAWDAVGASLGERYSEVLAPDLRGHGAAAATGPVSFDAVLSDVAALSSRRFVLAGYSMGGRLALAFALAHPQRVERLVLVGASPGLSDPGERAARRARDERLADVIERDGLEAFTDAWGRLPLWDGQPPAVAAAARADRLRNTAPGLAAALRGLGAGVMEPLWDRLAELRMPARFVAGARDWRFHTIAATMALLAPHGEAVAVPGAGHAVPLEAPEDVAGAIGG